MTIADRNAKSQSDVTTAISNALDSAADMHHQIIPIGGIIAYYADMTGVESLPEGFVECNGQTLSDSDSIFDGKVMPALNGTTDTNKRFVVGAESAQDTNLSVGSHTHTHTKGTQKVDDDLGSGGFTRYSPEIAPASSIPPYFEARWVIRVK